MKILYFVFSLMCLALISIVFVGCENKPENQEKQKSISFHESDKRKIKIVNALEKLQTIPFEFNSSNFDKKIFDEKIRGIENIIGEFDNPDDLVTLALLCRNLSRHCFDMNCFKESSLRATYENTYWAIVKKLATDKEKNKIALENLKNNSHLGDVDLGDWGKIVDGKEFP